MATAQENLARFQEIAKRGIQNRLPPEIRTRFDEAVKRGLISLPDQTEPVAPQETIKPQSIIDAEQALLSAQQGEFTNPRAKRSAIQKAQSDLERETFLSSLSEPQRNLIESQTPLDAFLIGAGRGLTTIGRGVGLAGEEDPATTQAIENLRQLQGGALTAGEIAGETAPFLLPATAIGRVTTLPARVAATTALGATEGGVIRSGQGGDASEISEGAGIGGAIAGGLELGVPVLGRVAGKIIRKATGKAPSGRVINPDGTPTEELLQALDQTGLTIDDLNLESRRLIEAGDPENIGAQARKAFLEEQGIIPTRAQVTGEAEDFILQQELAKSNERVRRALLGQEQAISSRFDNAIVETGGSANPSNAPVIDFIADKAIDEGAAISEAYKLARASAPTAQVVSPEKMIESIRSIAGSDNTTGGLASSARDILRNKGLLGKKGLKLQGRVSPTVAEEIRIELNQLHDSLTPFGKRKLSEVKNALDADVETAVGQDIFAEARASKAKFEKDLSRAKVNKFDSRKFNIVRDILENKINPDRFLDEAVLSKRVRSTDLEQLKRYMLLDGNEAGLQAWNSLRAEAMQRIRDDAFNVVGGEPALTRASLNRAVDKFGRDKLRVLFTQQERKFLNDMKKVSELREPKRGTQQGLGPSAQAILRQLSNTKTGGLLRDIFGAVQANREGRLILSSPDLSVPIRPLTTATLAAPAVVSSQEQE